MGEAGGGQARRSEKKISSEVTRKNSNLVSLLLCCVGLGGVCVIVSLVFLCMCRLIGEAV